MTNCSRGNASHDMDVNPENQPDTRTTFGWAWVGIIFTLLVGLQLSSYFGKGPQKVQYTASQSSLKLMMMSRMFLQGSSNISRSMSQDGVDSAVWRDRLTNPTAAKIFVARTYEAGDKLIPSDLKLLQDSKNADDRTFAEIYASKDLTPERAKALGAKLPKEPFIFDAARVHALEKAGVKSARESVLSQTSAKLMILALFFILLGTCMGAVVWLTVFALKAAGYLPALGHPAGTPLGADSARFASRVAQYMGFYILISVVLALSGLPKLVATISFGIFIVLSLPLLARVPIAGKLIPLRAQGWSTEHLGRNIVWGLAAAAANAPLMLLLGIVSNALFKGLPSVEHPVQLALSNSKDLLTVLLALGGASIMAPIFEETCFRGTLLPALTGRLGSVASAVVVSSLLFAAVHPTGLPTLLPLAGIGMTSCLLTYQTRSLVPSVVMHAVHNTVTLLLVLAMN